jgi:hypothetical protein
LTNKNLKLERAMDGWVLLAAVEREHKQLQSSEVLMMRTL